MNFGKYNVSDLVKEHWNTHHIRDSRHDTVPGRHDELFCLPEDHGGVDGLILPFQLHKLIIIIIIIIIIILIDI